MERKRSSNTTQSPRVIKFAKNPITSSPRVNQQTLAPTYVIPPDLQPTEHAPTPRTHKYNTRLNVAKHGANSIIDADTGRSLEYRHLILEYNFVETNRSAWPDIISPL